MTESSNYAKFQTRNPVVRRLIDRFYVRLGAIVGMLGAESVLDAGCGEGETLARLSALLPDRVAAVDVSEEAVEFTARRFPKVAVSQASLYELPFDDDSFDLLLCLEVLEHLDDPGAALAELSRVARADIVLSVPHEPWFRFGSLLRGKYLRDLGNHPEHVNHWGSAGLSAFLEPRARLITKSRSFPWLIAHVRPRRSSRSAVRPATGPCYRVAPRPTADRSARD